MHFLNACVWFRDVTSFSDASGMVCVRVGTCFYIDASDSLLWLTFTRTQTIPDASEKDVTLRSQTHAPKKRAGRLPCASSLTLFVASARTPSEAATIVFNITFQWYFLRLLGDTEWLRITLLSKGLNSAKSKVHSWPSPSLRKAHLTQRVIHMGLFQVTPC